MSSPTLLQSARVLVDYPEFAKVVIATGFLLGAVAVINPLVMDPLRARIWKEDMAMWTSLINALKAVLAIVCGGPLGRLMDTMDPRVVVLGVGLTISCPLLLLLALGLNEWGLLAHSVAHVLSGVACCSQSGSPALNCLAGKVMPSDAREVAFGLLYAGALVFLLAFNLLAASVRVMAHGSDRAVLVFALAGAAAFAAVVVSVRLPDNRKLGAGSPKQQQSQKDLEAPGDAPSSGDGAHGSDSVSEVSTANADSSGRGDASSQGSSCAGAAAAAQEAAEAGAGAAGGEAAAGGRGLQLPGPLRTLQMNASLRNLCIVACLVSIPEVALSDMNARYVYGELGYLDAEGPEVAAKERFVSSMGAYIGQGLVIPGFFFAGHFAKKLGNLRSLRMMVIMASFLIGSSALLPLVPEVWMGSLTYISNTMTLLLFPTLQALVVQAADEGRVGEALGLCGAGKQVAALVGNMAMVCLAAAMSQSPFLWSLYLGGGLFILCAWPFAARVRLPEAAGPSPGASCH